MQVALDANLLVLFIVGNLDINRIGARRLEAFQKEHLAILNEFVGRFRQHCSTPNVLTEASNFIGSGRQQLCKGGAATLGRYIDQLDEIYVPSKETLPGPFFEDLGLADAGLAELSRKGVSVITADGPMYGLMTGKGIKVVNFWHMVQLK